MTQTYKQRKHAIIQDLKENATPAEKRLLSELVKHNINFIFQKSFTLRQRKEMRSKWEKANGIYRDRPLKFYVADFYLPELRAIIEIDGEIHNGRYHQDANRTEKLIQNGKMVSHVLRFTNKDVFYNIERIIRTILSMRPTRMVKLNPQQYQMNRRINTKIAKQNEIESIVKNDPDTTWETKKRILAAK